MASHGNANYKLQTRDGGNFLLSGTVSILIKAALFYQKLFKLNKKQFMLVTNSTEKIGPNSIKQNKKLTSERKLPVKAKVVS